MNANTLRESAQHRRRTRIGLAATAVALCSLLVSAPAMAATPSTPVLTDVYVSAAGQITITWNASTDTGGHSLTYDVYRLPQPITGSNVGPLTPVASVTTTSATVAALSAEVEQSYVWFYAVRAKETTTPATVSAVSKTMAANLHGYRLSSTAVTCTRCHSVHGAYPDDYDYTYVDLCYRCHGATSAASAVGARSSLNVQAEFGDYGGQAQPGSIHRSTKMEADRTECDACHSAHRTSYYYDNNGAYVASSSYRKMIRVQTGVDADGPTYTYYSQNADLETPAAAGENAAFCLACHGANAAPIGYVGDAGDYALTGGDHNSAGYSTAAHGPTILKSNDFGRPAQSEYPQVQCLACHAKHASAADKLIAYRGSDAGGAYAEAGLCYACHSAASAESKVAAGYVKPFAWNDRDVQAEFGRASTHPATSSATGRSLTCANCHNVHNVAEGGVAAWSLSRVSTPSNTKNTPADMTAFCLDCHDGSPASATISDTALVPYRIGFSDQSTAPYFPGWDKSKVGADASLGFTNSGHYAASAANGKALCANCHDPHASDNVRLLAWFRPTGVTWIGGNSIAGDRSIGAARGNTVPKAAEERLCYNCHGNGTAAYPQAAGAADVYTPANPASGTNNKHVMAAYSERHSDLEEASDLGSTNRHSECVDCHDPHAAKKVGGTATQDILNTSAPGGAVYGAWGVVPDYANAVRDNTTNPGTYNWGTPTVFSSIRLSGAVSDTEAYLCFKCHSGNSTRPAGQSDLALEFNPSNFSVHNVLGQSVGAQEAFTYVASNGITYTDTWQFPTAGVFRASYDANTMLTCTSCHTSENAGDAKGPHGSTVQWLIDPNYPTDWKASYLVANSRDQDGMNGQPICQKCHDLYNAAGVVGNSAHSRPARHGNSSSIPCITCHIKVPHGWKRPRLLGYRGDDPAYATYNPTGALSEIRANDSHTRDTNGTAQWDSGDCSTDFGGASGCGGGTHKDIAIGW